MSKTIVAEAALNGNRHWFLWVLEISTPRKISCFQLTKYSFYNVTHFVAELILYGSWRQKRDLLDYIDYKIIWDFNSQHILADRLDTEK